jgi:hypothetical protein
MEREDEVTYFCEPGYPTHSAVCTQPDDGATHG